MSVRTAVLTAAALLMSVGASRAQVFNPIAIDNSSFTTDVVYGPAAGDTTADGQEAGWNYAAQGQDASNPTYGLPGNGTLVSASNTASKITTFQFQSYAAENVLLGDGTLTLTTPAAYTNLAFLVTDNSLYGIDPEPGPATFTVNFTDGSTALVLTTAGDIPWWIGGDPTSSGGTIAFNAGALAGFGGNIELYEYDFAVPTADADKLIKSIDVSSGSALATFAVSGSVVPEPRTWVLLLGGFALLGFATRWRAGRLA